MKILKVPNEFDMDQYDRSKEYYVRDRFSDVEHHKVNSCTLFTL